MLIVALVLAVIGLAALVTAVVTSNELIAWVCIAASVIGVVLLIVDALRERSHADDDSEPDATAHDADEDYVEDYPDDAPAVAEDETAAAPAESVDSDTAEVVDKDHNPR
jgi:broad specificity phosphatase PhoE